MGFVINKKPVENPSLHDYVWVHAAYGCQYQPDFEAKYRSINVFKRGLVFQPALNGKSDYDNGSFFFEQILGDYNPDWKNGAPIIIDIWAAPNTETQRHRFGFDNIGVLVGYIRGVKDKLGWPAGMKVLLRVNIGTWELWMKDANTAKTLKQWLDVIEPLLYYPGAKAPKPLLDFGNPAWWEYEEGLIQHDPSRMWPIDAEPVEPSEPEEPEEPSEPEEPEEPGEVVLFPRKYAIKLFGFQVGTVEAVEE